MGKFEEALWRFDDTFKTAQAQEVIDILAEAVVHLSTTRQ
jgi:hypothetical protein